LVESESFNEYIFQIFSMFGDFIAEANKFKKTLFLLPSIQDIL